jgi:hypothetical protein
VEAFFAGALVVGERDRFALAATGTLPPMSQFPTFKNIQ